MSFLTLIRTAVVASGVLLLIPSVAAHGQIKRVVANGVSNDGPNVRVFRHRYTLTQPFTIDILGWRLRQRQDCHACDVQGRQSLLCPVRRLERRLVRLSSCFLFP